MRILHVYKDYFPVLGGIENHLRWLATAQASRGHEVMALVTNPAERQTTVREEEGVRVIRAARIATVASTPLSLALPRELRRLRPDIVHLQFPYPVGEVSNLLFGRGRRTVISYQSDVVRQAGILRLYDPLLRLVLRRADVILASSPPYIQSSSYLAPLADRCRVLPLGVDVSRFSRPRPDRVASIRAQFPGPIILFVGRLRYYKGLSYLLQAMRDVQATLLIIGTGPEAVALGEQRQQSGISDHVHFLGDIGDDALPAYYQAADLFVLPSSHRSEAFGIVLLEAMAAGKPLVSTELGTGTSWINQDGVTGRVVPPRQAAALAEVISDLLADPDQRQRMGAAAQARARAEFDLPILVDRVLGVYEEALRKPAHTRPISHL